MESKRTEGLLYHFLVWMLLVLCCFVSSSYYAVAIGDVLVVLVLI